MDQNHKEALSINDSSIDSRCEPGRALAVPDDTAASRTQKLVAAGGILGAIAASSCCIAPLVLFSLGSSGAWIGNLTALAPYQPYFIAATLACLGYGYWLVYRRQKIACAEGEVCARPLPISRQDGPSKTTGPALSCRAILPTAVACAIGCGRAHGAVGYPLQQETASPERTASNRAVGTEHTTIAKLRPQRRAASHCMYRKTGTHWSAWSPISRWYNADK